MDITVTNLTLADISEAVRTELVEFFQNKGDQKEAPDEIGGVELAMQITGLAKATIYSRVSSRSLPHRKQGKKLYFSRRELKEWIDAGRRKTYLELRTEAEDCLATKELIRRNDVPKK